MSTVYRCVDVKPALHHDKNIMQVMHSKHIQILTAVIRTDSDEHELTRYFG